MCAVFIVSLLLKILWDVLGMGKYKMHRYLCDFYRKEKKRIWSDFISFALGYVYKSQSEIWVAVWILQLSALSYVNVWVYLFSLC